MGIGSFEGGEAVEAGLAECLAANELHTALHMTFLVAALGVAEAKGEAVVEGEAKEGFGGLFFGGTYEFGNGYTHVVVDHGVEGASGESKVFRVGILEGGCVLPKVEHGEAVVAVGGGEDGELVFFVAAAADVESGLTPVEFAGVAGLVFLLYVCFLVGLF